MDKSDTNILRVYISLLIVAFALFGCTSRSEGYRKGPMDIPNPHDNGYRLVRVTSDSNLADRDDYTAVYEYRDSENLIVRRSERGVEGFTTTHVDYLHVNNEGWLLAGNLGYKNPNDVYEYFYDEQGRLTEYVRNLSGITFSYKNGKLDRIVGNADEVSLLYGSAGQLESSTNLHGNATTYFEYNSFGQISKFLVYYGPDELDVIVDLVYDENGNLVKRTVVDALGEIRTIKNYEYEATERPALNQQLFGLTYKPSFGNFGNYIIDW